MNGWKAALVTRVRGVALFRNTQPCLEDALHMTE